MSNSSVWLCIPSARPPEEAEKVLKLWRERGYKIALLIDWNPPGWPLATRLSQADLFLRGGGKFRPAFDPKTGEPLTEEQTYPPDWNEYPGYSRAVNSLIKEVMLKDPQAEWFVCGGDDIEPDPNHSAEEIARECSDYFYQIHLQPDMTLYESMQASTFGVMQPTGDRWHEGKGGFTNAPIDRVCGSPWMGREFCRRIYNGNGPLWPEFTHMFGDEHLQNVAQKLGILWQRRDLIHRHNHWGRGETDDAVLNDPKIPAHLEKWNTAQHWQEARGIFERLKAGGFKEAEDLLP